MRSEQQRFSADLVRAAAINGVVLAAAVVAVFVLQLVEEDVGVWVILAVAFLGSLSVTAVVMAGRRRRAAATAVGQPGPAAAGPGPDGFVMAVQDVFTITGRGTVVTGSVQQGSVDVGGTVTLVRGGSPVQQVEVTGVEMVRRFVTRAAAGDEVGLLLRGVSRDDVERGDVLVA